MNLEHKGIKAFPPFCLSLLYILFILTDPFTASNLSVESVSTNDIELNWKKPLGVNGGFDVIWYPKHGQVNNVCSIKMYLL